MLRSPRWSLESFNKLLLKKVLDIIRNSIIIISIKREIRIDVNTKFLVLYLSLAIKIFNAVGRPSCAMLLSSKKVGIIIEYNPIPSVPINLVKIILIIIPSDLVKKPPIIRMRVDLINLFFIVQVYSINYKKVQVIKNKNGLLMIFLNFL